VANPVDYDTRDDCTRYRNLRVHCTRYSSAKVALINQFLVQHCAATYRTDDMHHILNGSIQVIVHHNVVIDICFLMIPFECEES